jgi:hypothetical protein
VGFLERGQGVACEMVSRTHNTQHDSHTTTAEELRSLLRPLRSSEWWHNILCSV